MEDEKTFNALRKLLLEKQFDENHKLHDDVMIATAINPNDTATRTLTKHTMDVLDIIDVALDWGQFTNFLDTKEKFIDLSEEIGFDIHKFGVNVLRDLADQFKSDIDVEGNELTSPMVRPYYWNTPDGEVIYISPREFDQVITSFIDGVHEDVLDMEMEKNVGLDEEEVEEIKKSIKNNFSDAWKSTIDFVGTKHQLNTNDISRILKMIETKIKKDYDTMIEELLQKVGSKNVTNISEIGELAKYDFKSVKDNPDSKSSLIESLKVYFSSTDDVSAIHVDNSRMLADLRNQTFSYENKFLSLRAWYDILEEIDTSQYSNALKARLYEGIVLSWRELGTELRQNGQMDTLKKMFFLPGMNDFAKAIIPQVSV